ncbi:hypothetical protein TCDM_11229 [Trypanosoma cruzi Dm28c]|uniref:Uncharacterized protein n=1 Tax=Trypanosoma cruzi Dm28c TaxID=1416333 RepID=V5B5D6_TRYCR|nr:hypothetical protein TCDM_11229 [Trypanosoma cruzi Dm28c]
MAGSFLPRDGWMRVRLLRVRCVVAAGFCHFPGAAGMSWGRWWWMSSSPAWWVTAGVVCPPCVDAVSWCVDCAAGPAALSSCCLRSRCIRCAPSLSLSFHSFPFRLTDQLTDTSDSTTGDDDCDGDGAAPCCPLRSCAAAARPFVFAAAGSPGLVSGGAEAVVVPVDVSCAPSDGSLSYRVLACFVGVEEVFCCQC